VTVSGPCQQHPKSAVGAQIMIRGREQDNIVVTELRTLQLAILMVHASLSELRTSNLDSNRQTSLPVYAPSISK
jgi:hypothetical protein